MILELWLDDHRAGMGWRLWIVIREGTKWVTLFNPATLLTTQIPKETWPEILKKARHPVVVQNKSEEAQSPRRTVNPRKLAKSIKKNVQERERLGLWAGGNSVTQALAALADMV
jgi:hypothetical protein